MGGRKRRRRLDYNLSPGEALFSHDFRKLLEQAMPDIDSKIRDQLLLHQFLAGLPISVSKHMRAATDLQEAIKIKGQNC